MSDYQEHSEAFLAIEEMMRLVDSPEMMDWFIARQKHFRRIIDDAIRVSCQRALYDAVNAFRDKREKESQSSSNP